jgi:hypothetical protein
MALKWLERQDIDEIKWEECINDSLFPSLFGRYWFWDAMTDGNWQAVIEDDYQAVLPVYKRRKWGLPYVTMPFLCQKTDIFSAKDYHIDFTKYFKLISKSIVKLEIKTSHHGTDFGHFVEKTNQILTLSSINRDVSSGYNRNTKRNITKSVDAGVHISFESNPEEVYSFIKKHDVTGLIDSYGNQVKRLISESLAKGRGFGVKAKLNGNVISMAFFIRDTKRLYFLLCTSNDTGKKVSSMYQLIDHVIQSNASTDLIFDFTGSSMENIARRNRGFGATEETYYHVKWNIFGI